MASKTFINSVVSEGKKPAWISQSMLSLQNWHLEKALPCHLKKFDMEIIGKIQMCKSTIPFPSSVCSEQSYLIHSSLYFVLSVHLR